MNGTKTTANMDENRGCGDRRGDYGGERPGEDQIDRAEFLFAAAEYPQQQRHEDQREIGSGEEAREQRRADGRAKTSDHRRERNPSVSSAKAEVTPNAHIAKWSSRKSTADPGPFCHGPRRHNGSAKAAHPRACEQVRRATTKNNAACHAMSASMFSASAAERDGPTNMNATTAPRSCSVPWGRG